CALLVTLGLYSIQRIAPFARLFDELMAGIESMLVPLGIIFIAFILQVVNEKLGLAPYLIESVTPYMDAQWLPALTFLLLAALAFSTGTFWGVYAIALPIVVPLAQSLEANMPLTLGALISAGAFGSHACFFGDATVISAKGCGITPMQHAVTQLPYVLIAAGLSFLLFLFAA
ncbi:Na+/H+ antiporter NhaC family protein, partial [Oceanospirillum sp. HFRX-1_2]